MKNKKRIVAICIKLAVLVTVCVLYNHWLVSLEPVFNNEFAIQQMQHDAGASMAFAAYANLKNLAGSVYIILCIALFHSELVLGIGWLMNKLFPKKTEEPHR